MDLKELVPLLRANGVRKFKQDALEIEFEVKELPAVPIEAQFPPGMPADLRDPNGMNPDKVRDWSSSPEFEDAAGPPAMTGDAPLDPGTEAA